MLQIRGAVVVLLAAAFLASAAVPPTPRDHLGYEPGTDYKLANYQEIIGYFQKLAGASDRIRLVEYGKTSMGKPSWLAIISSPENLKNLERLKEINRRLALGEASRDEAQSLAAEGKVFVWIDSGLHASEVAPAQHSPELAYRVVTGEDEETRRIRRETVLLQIPVINPDGLDMIVDWYRGNVGTPYELAPLPRLYQKYAGHDNNRDWFMMNLAETRNVSKLLFREWYPQIVYNQHQSPAFPARIFVPPYAEPLNPNIPATVMEGINLIGSAMKDRFARENKPGILSYYGFDAWWNGGLRSVPAFHNMHGILTETALNGYATPRVYKSSEFPERFGNGMPTKEPTVFYQRPWMGGKWGTREAIEYMLTADFAILDLASSRKPDFLLKSWRMAIDNIEAGTRSQPYAWIVPQDQWDPSSADEMLRRLQLSGIRVNRARAAFRTGSREWPAGTRVLLAGQPFRPYLADLMEPQRYPEIRSGTAGPTKRPYDVAGWTLPMQMGVSTHRAEDAFQADLETLPDIAAPERSWNSRENAAFHAVAASLKAGESLRWSSKGALLRKPDAEFARAAWELRVPRLALYEPSSPNMDTGWTEWLLDYYGVPFTRIGKADFGRPDLRKRFDTILFASEPVASILHGWREGEHVGRIRSFDSPAQQRPEYTGGIGLNGAALLHEFVRAGGTVITFDAASELPVHLFPLPLRSVLSRQVSSDDGAPQTPGYYCPGSILRISVDNSHPIGFGMPADAFAFQSGGQAWDVTLLSDYNKGDRAVRSVARYAQKNVLASGWLSGERVIAGRTALAEARVGAGRVVLF
ncbi:MAG TPA: M14 metallopeptidase family protein, partial [Bryobacteraceae bacterium]|nr:M14 metallopeptidase family protein [Bryobacteraceae bacterium]